MRATRRVRARWLLAVVAAFGLLAAACGDDDDGGASPDAGEATTTTAGDDGGDQAGDGEDGEAPGEPQRGGSLTAAMFSTPRGMDPIQSSGSGTAGGTELIALYDTVVRWNPETLDYDMRTAESLEPNDDFTQWTLTLKDGIEFRDGTPYNAEAVALSFERHKGPQNQINASRAHLIPVTDWEVLDELTIRFDLREPWPGFPYVLADEPGMIVSPTAIEALGDPDDPGYSDRFEEFAQNPVGAGAGPFEIVRFRPGEDIVMERNPDYWDGDVYLDELRFVVFSGPAATFEALQAGNVDAAYIRSPSLHQQAKDEFEGFENFASTGDLLLINQGVEVTCQDGEPAPACEGEADGAEVRTEPPGASLKVRQAVAAAIDPEVINQRVHDGLASDLVGKDLFHESFPWKPDVASPEFDPERARELVEEAKAEGWDGEIDFVSTDSPERRRLALAVESMLLNVGFEVNTTTDLDVAAHIQQVIGGEFELSVWGMAINPDDGAVLALVQNWRSDSATNRVGYQSEAMDEAITAALHAATDAEKTEAFGRIADIYREEMPSLVNGAAPEYFAWADDVHGIYPTQATMMHFDKAWMEQ